MRALKLVCWIVVLSVLLAACGSTAPAADSVQSVKIEVESKPSPAVVGDVEVVFIVTDENGNPIEGAQVDVAVDHTDMSGMNMSGAATDQGSGKYSIKANFSMSGTWKLTVSVRNDSGLDYKEDIEFAVQ